MTVYEMADKYYNGIPRMWDEKRLLALLNAGKLTQEEYQKILNKNK